MQSMQPVAWTLWLKGHIQHSSPLASHSVAAAAVGTMLGCRSSRLPQQLRVWTSCTCGAASSLGLRAIWALSGLGAVAQAPEVWDLLERIKQVVKPFGVQLLCEVHEDFALNIELAR